MLSKILIAVIFFALGAGGFFAYAYYSHNAQMLFLNAGKEGVYQPQELQAVQTAAVYAPNALDEKKATLMREGRKFITADLTAMQLQLYEGESVIFTAPITAKGKDGTSWETPSGAYEVLYKNSKHFSSLGRVYMPWSLQFQGNFFIHGTPHLANGRELFSQHSAGCIRLTVENAKKLYGLVGLKTPVLVYETVQKKSSPAIVLQAGTLSAQAFLVADIEKGFVYTQRNAQELRRLAEITHLITAIVATEHLVIDRAIYADKGFLIPTRIPRLEPGKKYRLYDYIGLSLQESSHEAAYAMIRPLTLSKALTFIDRKRNAVGMKNTVITDPSGRAPENLGTAEDVYQLMRYMYYNRRFLLEMTKGIPNNEETYGAIRFSNIKNTNLFYQDPTFVGGKSIEDENGVVQGGAFVFMMPFGEESRATVFIVFDSENVELDIQKAKTFVQNNFAVETIQ